MFGRNKKKDDLPPAIVIDTVSEEDKYAEDDIGEEESMTDEVLDEELELPKLQPKPKIQPKKLEVKQEPSFNQQLVEVIAAHKKAIEENSEDITKLIEALESLQSLESRIKVVESSMYRLRSL